MTQAQKQQPNEDYPNPQSRPRGSYKNDVLHRLTVRFRVFDQEQKPVEFECIGKPFLYLIKRRIKLMTNPGFSADEGISAAIDEEMASPEHVSQKEHCSTVIIQEIEVDNGVSIVTWYWVPDPSKPFIRKRKRRPH